MITRRKPIVEHFDFNIALSIEPVYDPPDRFLEAFYLFDGRLKSLQRYFEFGAKFVKTYLCGKSAFSDPRENDG